MVGLTVYSVQNSPGWSKSRLASEFEIDRRTVDKILKPIAPCGTSAGNPVYALKDAALAITQYLQGNWGEGQKNPDDLPPKERKDWYDGEARKIQIEREKGALYRKRDADAALAEILKNVLLTLDTLADVVERDVGLTPSQVEKIQEIVDREREQLADRLLMVETPEFVAPDE